MLRAYTIVYDISIFMSYTNSAFECALSTPWLPSVLDIELSQWFWVLCHPTAFLKVKYNSWFKEHYKTAFNTTLFEKSPNKLQPSQMWDEISESWVACTSASPLLSRNIKIELETIKCKKIKVLLYNNPSGLKNKQK